MQKILVTGIEGFLGSYVAKEITARSGIKVISTASYHGKKIDLRKPFNILPEDMPDVIIHIAGKAHSIPKTPEEEKEFYSVNFEGTRNLCMAVQNFGQVKCFIFISTVAVYGLTEGSLISEEAGLAGNTPYAKSKILAEKWLEQWADKQGISLVILRLPLLVGKNPPGNLGDMIRSISKGRYFNIGYREARKSMLLAEDVAAIIPVLIEKNISGVFNLTDGVHPTIHQLAASLSAQMHKPPLKTIPLFVAKCLAYAGDFVGQSAPINSDKLTKLLSTLTFDDTKARNMFNWNPRSVLRHTALAAKVGRSQDSLSTT